MEVESSNENQQTQFPPNETLYINNINERVKHSEMKMALYALFSDFGTIIDLLYIKTMKMKGQAFITFTSIESAVHARNSLNHINFFDKELTIDYAPEKSDLLSKLEGNPVNRTENRANQKPIHKGSNIKKRKEEVPNFPTAAPSQPSSQPKKSQSVPNLQPLNTPPNNILFVQNLPEDVTDDLLTILFHQYDGFKEVRLVRGRGVIAFVEYEEEPQASVAMEALQHFKIPPKNNPMVISYAKK